MKLKKDYNKNLTINLSTLTGRLRDILIGKNYTYLLTNNKLLKKYQESPGRSINNFLRTETYHQLFHRWSYNPDKTDLNPVLLAEKNEELKEIQDGDLSFHCIYPPITKSYIQSLIKIDRIMRASKRWNTEPIKVYRGTVKNFDMIGLNSCSIIQNLARGFGTGTFLKINLPANFPYLRIYELSNCSHKSECEILLPPCEFTIVNSYDHPGTEYSHDHDIIVKPLNLAKTFLECMKKPPENYPKTYLTDPRYQYYEAMAMLEKYIKNEVDKGIIRLYGKTLIERNDPKIEPNNELEPNEE